MFNFFTDIRTALKNIEAKVDALFHFNNNVGQNTPAPEVAEANPTPAAVEPAATEPTNAA